MSGARLLKMRAEKTSQNWVISGPNLDGPQVRTGFGLLY